MVICLKRLYFYLTLFCLIIVIAFMSFAESDNISLPKLSQSTAVDSDIIDESRDFAVTRKLPLFGLNVDISELKGTLTKDTHTVIFRVLRRGEAMNQRLSYTKVLFGSGEQMVPPGVERLFKVVAHTNTLQRIIIGDKNILINLPHNAEISLVDDPCTGWRLEGDWLDPNAVGPGDAYCVSVNQSCRPGFVVSTRPKLANDPLWKIDIEAGFKRCVRAPCVRFCGTKGAIVELLVSSENENYVLHKITLEEQIVTRWYELPIPTCDFPLLLFCKKSMSLAIGVGEKWTLTINPAGMIVGIAEGEMYKEN